MSLPVLTSSPPYPSASDSSLALADPGKKPREKDVLESDGDGLEFFVVFVVIVVVVVDDEKVGPFMTKYDGVVYELVDGAVGPGGGEGGWESGRKGVKCTEVRFFLVWSDLVAGGLVTGNSNGSAFGVAWAFEKC